MTEELALADGRSGIGFTGAVRLGSGHHGRHMKRNDSSNTCLRDTLLLVGELLLRKFKGGEGVVQRPTLAAEWQMKQSSQVPRCQGIIPSTGRFWLCGGSGTDMFTDTPPLPSSWGWNPLGLVGEAVQTTEATTI